MSTTRTSRSFPTFRYLAMPFRWFFRSRRRVMTTLTLLVAMIAAPPLWWSIQLVGLPDIGDPFDVEAFRSSRIPDEQNAFVVYEQAIAGLRPLKRPAGPNDSLYRSTARWPKAPPQGREWLDQNRAAMEVYRRGTERPDAQSLVEARGPFTSEMRTSLLDFHYLAWLEASRLEDRGEMATAWGWYRAALRASYHLGRRGTTYDRVAGQALRKEIAVRIDPWAADPRTTPEMLRRALDDVLACEALLPSEPDSLRADYAFVEFFLKHSGNPGRSRIFNWLRLSPRGPGSLQIPSAWGGRIVDAWRFWRREPDRSRRVIRLALANWLAYYDLPPDRRPAPDPNVSGRFDFYTFGPEAPANARALSPKALDHWLETAADAPDLLAQLDHRRLRFGELAGHRAMVVMLASELYKRDRGAYPKTDEALVGPYLKSLPDDGSGGLPAADVP